MTCAPANHAASSSAIEASRSATFIRPVRAVEHAGVKLARRTDEIGVADLGQTR